MFSITIIIICLVELKKLQAEGFGVYVDKSTMEVECFAAFVKRDILDIPEKFFDMATSSECTKEMYVSNYDKPMDMSLKKVAALYHQDKQRLTISLESNMSDSNFFFFKLIESIPYKYTKVSVH